MQGQYKCNVDAASAFHDAEGKIIVGWCVRDYIWIAGEAFGCMGANAQ
jgi:hypothetical protein